MKKKLLILFLTCVVGWLSPLNAQTVTLGGDLSAKVTDVPFRGLSTYAMTQQIYTSAEIGTSGTITGISLNLSTNNSSYSCSCGIEVYLKHVTDFQFSENKTKVLSTDDEYYDGTYEFKSGWNEIPINNFSYNGKDNLLVCVNLKSGSPGTSLYFYAYTKTNGSLECHSNKLGYDPIASTTANNIKNYTNNLQITFATGPTVTVTHSPEKVYTGTEVTLTASATGGSGNYTSYVWDCTSHTLNGTEFWGSGNAYEHTFLPTATGDYTFTCTVTDSKSNTATSEHVVTVTEESESAIDLNKQYRVKVYSGNNGVGNYLTVFGYSTNSTTNMSSVGVSQYAENNMQIFTIEESDNGNYYLKDQNGYYIICGHNDMKWNVDAVSPINKTALAFDGYTGGTSTFYIRDSELTGGKESYKNYFKVNDYTTDGGYDGYLVYCDADKDGAVKWVLDECVETLDFTIDLPKTYVCDTEETIQLSANVESGNGGYTYAWTGEGISDADKNIANPTVTIPDVDEAIETYEYTCTVSDAKGQTETEKVYLFVCDVITDLTLTAGEITIVEGNSTTLTSNIPDKYNNWTIQWEPCVNVKNSCNGGITNETTALTETTTFKLTATNPNNPECSSVAQVTVNVTPDQLLRVEVNAENDNICDNGTTQFNALASRGSGEGYIYKWSTNDVEKYPITCLSNPDVANPVFTPVENTEDFQTYEYVCTVTDSEGKTASATIYVYVRDYYELTPIVENVEYGNPVTFDFSAYPGIWQVVNADAVLGYGAYTNDYVNNQFTINSVTEDIDLTLEVSNGGLCVSTTGITIRATNVPVKPETDVIGDGDNWMTDAYNLPTYTSQEYVLSQQIYTQDELLTMLEENATINKIAFKASVVKNTAATRNFDIYLLNTDKETFESADDFVSIPIENRYYSGEVIFTAGEWAEIELDKGFQYANKNVILCVSDKTGPYKSTMNEALAAVEEASWLPVDKEPAKQLIKNLFKNDETIKLSQYEAGDLIASTEMPTWNVTVTDADGNPTVKTETMTADQAQGVVQNTFNSAGRNDYYGYTTSNRAILKYNYSKASEAYVAPNFAIDNTFEESKALSYNSQIQLTYTKWAGSSDINDASITVDNEEICYYEDNLGETINYFNFEAAKINGASYQWNFGDGSEGVGQKVTHNYLNHGTYNVTLTVTQGENTKVVTKEVVVLQKPTAEFTLDHSCYFVGQEMQFTPDETIANSTYELKVWEADGSVEYNWNYSEYKHKLTHDGTATVRYTHKNGEDCFESKDVTVEVYPTPIFSSKNTCHGDATEFSVVLEGISDYNNWNFSGTEGFVWDFGDGKGTSNGETVTYTYGAHGKYDVKLTVYKGDNSYTYSHEVEIISLPENVDFEWNNDIVKEDITFTPEGADSYLWTINGVEVSEGVLNGILTYRFEETGTYTIGLTATSSGCSVYVEKEITVENKTSAPLVMQDGKAVESINMGNRPVGSWMYPIDLVVVPDGTTDMHINSITIVDKMPDDAGGWIEVNYAKLTSVVENVTVKPEESIDLQLTHDDKDDINKAINKALFGGAEGTVNGIPQTEAQMIINYGNSQEKVINISYNAYPPVKGDVWEYPHDVTFNNGSYTNTITPERTYLLEGATSAHKDAVYKLSLSTNAKVTATVTGTNPLVYVYPGDFGGEPGPGLTNYIGYEPETRGTRASADGSLDIMLGAGTYYLVAAAENQNFTVTVSAVELLVPMIADKPSPEDKKPNVSTTLEQLEWKFGENTEEYQVLFGTTNPPTNVLVEWNSNIESENGSCALNTLMTNNTVYYWQVNVRNIVGENEDAKIWRFATPFDAPQNLALTSTEINLDDVNEKSPTLKWDAVAPTTITGYNIWAGKTLLTEEPITGTTYVIDIKDLEFSAEPYKIQVEAIYMVGDFRITSRSSSVELKVNAKASVKGCVRDATTSEPLVGATVTYATEVLTTDANGCYSGEVPAGNYTAVARMSGYNKCEVDVELVPSEYTKDFNLVPTKTMATGVVATENAGKTAVDVKWQFNSEGDPMFENFENGFTYEWTTSADYPWTVVDITGGPDETVNAGVFGQKCAKSGNYNVPSSTSWIELSAFIPFDGKISFYYRISSENPSDYGSFYIGEDQQFIIDYEGDPNAITAGSTLWQDGYREFDVKAGEHTFRWEYVKDYGSNVDEDAFYIDNISFYKNTNVYNVYRQDILTPAAKPVLLEDSLTKKEFEDAKWATVTDGIYQWGVSVLYNEPAGDLLNEDFEVLKGEMYRINIGDNYNSASAPAYSVNDFVVIKHESEYAGYDANVQRDIYTHYYYGFDRDANEEPLNNGWTQTEGSNWFTSACADPYLNQDIWAKDFSEDTPTTSMFGMNNQSLGGHYYLVTPMINTLRQSYLVFDYIVPQFSETLPQYFNKFRVVYREKPEDDWTALTEYNNVPVNEWTRDTIELPLVENFYIAFENYDHEDSGLGVGLDNVSIYREAVNGESNITWSNLIGKGNELVTSGNWSWATCWSRNSIPNENEVAIIKADGTVDGTGAVAKAVLVDNGALIIGESGVLTAQTVIDSVATDITINAGGQLVHSNPGVIATFIKGIERYTDADNNDGWYTISSPLAANIDASKVGGLLEGNFDLYRYDEPTHYWENYKDDDEHEEGPNNEDWDNNSAVIEKGRGYLYANSANKQLSFVGELNVADVTTTLSAEATKLKGFNLLGNPFAHNIYKGAAFNGSIADAHYTLNNHGEWQVVTSDNPIKSGAGFLVQAKTDGGADLTISKTNAQPRAAANSMLAVTVVNNVFEDVAYVSFNDGIGLEKIGHMNEYAPMVYIPGDFNNYAYATVEEDVTEVPVNFEAMTMGEYTIAVKAKNCEYETMVLVDNLTGKETNLLKDSYTFMATTTDDPDRFVIKLAKDAEVEDSFIYINNGELIFDNLSNDAIINVFDVLGRNIATFNNCGDTTFRVSTDLFADGVYMVRVIEGNNVKVQKMVIE